MKAILAVAVLAMAAFAGVMIVGDDADAAESDGYTITYSYNGITAQEKTDADGKISVKNFKTEVLQSAVVPEGYEFKYWISGSAVYSVNPVAGSGEPRGTTTFMGDATLVPYFAPNKAIVKIVCGDIEKEFVGDTTKTLVESDLTTLGGLVDTTFTITDNKISASKTGFEFKGFFAEADTARATPLNLNQLTQGSVGIATFVAVFEPVFEVSYIVEGVNISTVTSDTVKITSQAYSGIPKAPVKDNYLFLGWQNEAGVLILSYSEAAPVQYAFSDSNYKIAEDTTLYAKFVPVTFTVTFVYGEEKIVFTTETVKYGDLAIEPKGLPEGYKGWDWNFGTKIIADTEIVAIVADPVTVYTVTFEIDGKAPVTQRSDSMVLPDTTIEGKVFQGWVVKGESQYVSPMSYDITGDITFVAVYKEADPPAGPSFFETTEGKCVAVLIAVVIIAFVYAVYSNMFGLKDALTSVKITRVKK